MACRNNLYHSDYSIFGIAVDRMHKLEWLFQQGKATFQCSQKVYVYSEIALAPECLPIGPEDLYHSHR